MFMKMGIFDVVNSTQACISNIFKNILCDEGNIMRIRLVSSQLTFMPLFKIYTTISIIVLLRLKLIIVVTICQL